MCKRLLGCGRERLPTVFLPALSIIPETFANPSELQGIHTAKDVHMFLKARNRIGAYPLFDKVYHICWEGMDVNTLTDGL